MITFKQLGRLGRFGNSLFQIAGTIGIATKNGQPYCFPKFINWDAKERFGTNEDINCYEHLVNELPEMHEDLLYTDIGYHWEYRDYKVPTGNWNICSHLQDPRYFEHCMPLIRETFRFKNESPLNDYVAIHYRAGDYIDDPNAYHPRCGIDYYRKAIQQFPKGSEFIVFSDNLIEAYRILLPFIEGRFAIYPDNPIDKNSHRNYIGDFLVMKRCKHFITANSSFSLMAAILGEHPDKKIVSPKRWFGTAANGLTFEGYPKNAIVI